MPPVFGDYRADTTYVRRPSAYVVARDADGRIAVVEAPEGYFLPGGGLEDGETPEQALRRELIEECGVELAGARVVGTATEYVRTEEGQDLAKPSTFFSGQIVVCQTPGEHEYRLHWLTQEQAGEVLKHGSHRWAVGLNPLVHG